jgi:hypothetical protein
MNKLNKPDRKKAVGRPRFEAEAQKRRSISLSDRIANIAREIGGGNVSEGIRLAIINYKK